MACFRRLEGEQPISGLFASFHPKERKMKKTTKVNPIVIGSAFAAAALAPLAQASDNPFVATSLATGYQLAQADGKQSDGKCGEAKCGAEKKSVEKKKEGKCGEAKCGADKKTIEKKKEGKCGEAKCGADKK
jgi:uncharacterized low-complexity protein